MKFQLKFEIKREEVLKKTKTKQKRSIKRKGPGRPIKPKAWTQEEIDWLVAHPRANKTNDVRGLYIKRFKKNRTLKSLQSKRRKTILKVKAYASKLG